MKKIKINISNLQLVELNNYFNQFGGISGYLRNMPTLSEQDAMVTGLFREAAEKAWNKIHSKVFNKMQSGTKGLSLTENEARVFHFFSNKHLGGGDVLQAITINTINAQIHQEVIA